MTLDRQSFRQAANDIDQAKQLVDCLGNDLARWVIRDDVLERLANRFGCPDHNVPPNIAQSAKQPGACVIVVVSDHGISTILNDSYLLPVHWRKGGKHDDRLPSMLRQVADEVQKTLGRSGYSLQLMLPGQTGPKQAFLPDVTDGMDSAFAALACGLQMLEHEVTPDFRTVCTGRLSGSRISSVSHIAQKTRAVLNFPPRAIEKRFQNWFVPSGDGDEAAKSIEEHIRQSGQLVKLNLREFAESDSLTKQVASLLACSGIKPDPNADFSALQEYYQWLQALDQRQAEQYYSDVLYPQIASRGFVGGIPHDARPTHFVSVVSSPALIGLAHQLFKFKKVLILYTVPPASSIGALPQRLDYSKRAMQAKELIHQDFQSGIHLAGFEYRPDLAGNNLWKHLVEVLQPHIEKFHKGVSEGAVMWDMTSGLRLFTHILEKHFARNNDWMLTINQQWSSQLDYRIPCTETLVAWRHQKT